VGDPDGKRAALRRAIRHAAQDVTLEPISTSNHVARRWLASNAEALMPALEAKLAEVISRHEIRNSDLPQVPTFLYGHFVKASWDELTKGATRDG
jgi:hypothetical protein